MASSILAGCTGSTSLLRLVATRKGKKKGQVCPMRARHAPLLHASPTLHTTPPAHPRLLPDCSNCFHGNEDYLSIQRLSEVARHQPGTAVRLVADHLKTQLTLSHARHASAPPLPHPILLPHRRCPVHGNEDYLSIQRLSEVARHQPGTAVRLVADHLKTQLTLNHWTRTARALLYLHLGPTLPSVVCTDALKPINPI